MKNKFRIFLVICIVVLVLTGVLIFADNQPQTDRQEISNVNEARDPKEEIHPVSIPAIMQKEFDGRDFILGQILDDNSFYTRYYITYKSGELTISGIMNVPKGEAPVGGFPLLILNHGHIDTAVYTNGRGLRREQDYFARQGYVVVHPDYRNHADSSKDERDELAVRLSYAEDVINAVYAVKSSGLDFVNTDNVGMLGHSMGGGVTLLALVVAPGLVDAAILYAPVTGNLQDSYERWIERRPESAEQIANLYGSPDDSPDFWKNVNAENFFERITAPIRIFHGTTDESVPLEWSEETRDLLNALGKQVELTIYPGAPHEFGSDWSDFMNSCEEFFAESLK